jgi:PPP family 3-phenylpropionic acid transporter
MSGDGARAISVAGVGGGGGVWARVKQGVRDTRVHYFLTYAALGAVQPYVSVFMINAGLSKAQVGLAFAIWSAASVLSPVLVTRIADGRGGDPRRLLALAAVIVAACQLALPAARGAGAMLGVWSIYCLASMPMFPLQDGVHFSQQQRRRERGQRQTPYHLVRVWGTIGYMAPSLALLPFLRTGMRLGTVIAIGGGLALLAAVQAEMLEDPRGAGGGNAGSGEKGRAAAPTLRAAEALLRPPMLALSLAVLLVGMTATMHGAFFPVYLTERLGVPEAWLGQVSNLAVIVEALFIFACGRLVARLGARRVLVVATAATAARFAIVAVSHNAWIVVGTQVLHGLLILTTAVLPQVIFDERASDAFRHSMQGVLVMFTSAGKSLASLGAGVLATRTVPGVFVAEAVMCAVASGLVVWGFREGRVGQGDRVAR